MTHVVLRCFPFAGSPATRAPFLPRPSGERAGVRGLLKRRFNRSPATRLSLASLLQLALLPSIASAAAPTLTHVTPPGGRRGEAVAVKCQGKFDWPVSVDAPGLNVTVDKESSQLQVAIPPGLAADRAWIRLYNAEGASTSVPFLIGDLKEIAEKEPNNSTKAPQNLEDSSVTINGVLSKSDVDAFAVKLEAGQTLACALDANTRLGSPMDAILQVARPDGFVLAENHDDVGLDPRLIYQSDTAQTVVVRIFAFPSEPNSTISFFGTDSNQYRLTITTGPYVSHAVPLSAPVTEPGTVELFGWNLPPASRAAAYPLAAQDGILLEYEPLAEARLPAEAQPGFLAFPGTAGSARLRLVPWMAVSNVGTSSASSPLPLTLPVSVTGRLALPRQVDRYQLNLTKGQKLLISAEGRELDFPVVPVLNLIDPAGAVVATFEDASPKKLALISFTVPKDGQYELTIRDRHRLGGERHFYQLTARLDEPDFELTASAETLVIPHDKPAELTVNVVRRGSGVGPITISAAGLPEGVTADEVVSETKGDSAAKVKLTFKSTGVAFNGPVQITGVVKEPNEIRHRARTAPRLGACFESLWLTSIAKPEEKPPAAPPADPPPAK